MEAGLFHKLASVILCVLYRFQFQGEPNTAHPGVAHKLSAGSRSHVRKTTLTWALLDRVLRMEAAAKNRFSLPCLDFIKKPSLPQTLEPVQGGLGSWVVPSHRAVTVTLSHQPTPQGSSAPKQPCRCACSPPGPGSRRRGPPARAEVGGRLWGPASAHNSEAHPVGRKSQQNPCFQYRNRCRDISSTPPRYFAAGFSTDG